MKSDKFLLAVADYYFKASQSGKIDISELCLVFPNKRAAIFFRLYFKRLVIESKSKDRISFMPTTMTIGAFQERLYSEDIADRIQLQFILYKAYRNVLISKGLSDKAKSFERFAFLGDMILSDFDDIDKEMLDAQELYVNLERYNEISSKYLTEDQIKVIKEIWGNDITSATNQKPSDDDGMWNHAKSSQKFLKFWHILYPLYTEFHSLLKRYKLSYPGLAGREVAKRVCNGDGLKDLPFKRIGFVGFNILSKWMEKMMAHIRDKNIGDFFWDLLPEEQFTERAGACIRKLSQSYPMPDGYVPPIYTHNDCRIKVYGIPSNTLQAKAAHGVLSAWNKCTDDDGNAFINTKRPDNTVVVMPDQSLLSPMLNALPEEYEQVNITMGLSYRDTPFASLLRTIVSLQTRSREIKGENYFSHEDISAIIANPNMRAIALDSCLAIKAYLAKYHQWNVPVELLRKEILNTGTTADGELTAGAKALLCTFDLAPQKKDLNAARQYILSLMSALNNALQSAGSNNSNDVDVLNAYQRAIDSVFKYIDDYSITNLSENSIFSMLERLLALNTLNMSGSPVNGLQIMGVLETRAIDFDNVIVLSMNEDVYPRRNRQHSLIPQFMRSAYELPTLGDSEQEYSYYFYRLFSRSKRVVCLYDSRTSGNGCGAMSRYLLQIHHLYPQAKISFANCSLFAKQSDERKISINKASIAKELEAFTTHDEERKLNLSASALKAYRKCQLRFYLEYVKRVREDDTPTAFMDSATYGNVMHSVLQELFINQRKSTKPAKIDKNILSAMINSNIRGMIERKINEIYHRASKKAPIRLTAESSILAEIMEEFIKSVLDREKQELGDNGYFFFIDAEEKLYKDQWEIDPNLKINFRFDIDRHDELSCGVHRFVDYKTGSDKTEISSIENLFNTSHKTANDAALQLLIYAAAYSQLRNANYNIRPALYKMKTVMSNKTTPNDYMLKLKSDDETIELEWVNNGTIPKWQHEFSSRLKEMIKGIFNGIGDFEQTTEIENCRYCPFLQMCARIVPEQNY